MGRDSLTSELRAATTTLRRKIKIGKRIRIDKFASEIYRDHRRRQSLRTIVEIRRSFNLHRRALRFVFGTRGCVMTLSLPKSRSPVIDRHANVAEVMKIGRFRK